MRVYVRNLGGTPIVVDVRNTLPAARPYFTNGSTGSNTNEGLTAATPFATIQKGVDTIAQLDTSIFGASLTVAAGTYNETVTVKDPIGSGTCTLIGDGANPSNVIISKTGGHCLSFNGAKRWTVQGFKLSTTTSGFGVLAFNGAVTSLSNMECGALTAGFDFINTTDPGTYVVVTGLNNKWSGNCNRLFSANNLSQINYNGKFTLTGNVTVGQTAFANGQAEIQANGTWALGAFGVTGQRYIANARALIQTFGGGLNYFPGSVAGVELDDGLYL